MSMYNNAPLKQIKKYTDGRTKQSFANECDINLIMARAAQGGTISHIAKFEGIYADFSDFNFHDHLTKLSKGEEVFAALPAEIRREFGQSAQAFFDYVNDPANIDDLATKLPGLAKPGTQLPLTSAPDADTEAALAAASKPVSATADLPAVKTPPLAGEPS